MSLSLPARLAAFLGALPGPGASVLEDLVERGLDRLPLPGSGRTLERWQALAEVGRFDLSLAKLYEGHTDALAILAELQPGAPAWGSWGVWAAEAPEGRALLEFGPEGGVLLQGTKCWCSGAGTASHALLTAWDRTGGGPFLVAVALDQPGIAIDTSPWQAVGMAGSASNTVHFRNVAAQPVGGIGQYLSRPGFWQGGAGVAACWLGGAIGIASVLRESLRVRPSSASPFRLAALGKLDLALGQTSGLMREAAAWIDAFPTADASAVALRVRLAAEQCARLVMDEAGKAMGAAPFCLDGKFARAVADLPVFIRQSHAEKDFAALGERVLEQPVSTWTL